MNTIFKSSNINTKNETQVLEVFDNTSEFAMKINESKARLIYHKYFKATNGGTVLSFFGAFITCLTTILTASFNDIFGILGSASLLKAIFIILTFIFLLLTIIWFCKWIYGRKKLNEDSFIIELKGANKN